MTKRETILQAIADAAATDVALQYHRMKWDSIR